ncbi:MAG: Lpg1974 family pore-forming outer membrane protein [Pirellulales bacterium]
MIILKRFALVILVLVAGGGLAMAQTEEEPGDATLDDSAAAQRPLEMGDEQMMLDGMCAEDCYPAPWRARLFAGAEYRHIRPHFSEAVAFATVTDSIGATGFSRRVAAHELDFDYESSMRLFLGYHLNDCADVRLTYWYLDAETFVSGTAGAGQTIVDPFGNLGPTGTEIGATATVQMNVFDLEYLRPIGNNCDGLGFLYSAGLRFADVSQFYDSTISAAGAVTSNGVFEVDYFGVGPYLSLTGDIRRGQCRQFSLFAKGAMALLVGQYDVSTDVTLTGASGGQTADRVRTTPVLESELGVAWLPNDRVRFTAGWLFQAWFNLGTSGGTFDGEQLPIAPVDTAFGGADDADIMSFDGLFLRAEIGY